MKVWLSIRKPGDDDFVFRPVEWADVAFVADRWEEGGAEHLYDLVVRDEVLPGADGPRYRSGLTEYRYVGSVAQHGETGADVMRALEDERWLSATVVADRGPTNGAAKIALQHATAIARIQEGDYPNLPGFKGYEVRYEPVLGEVPAAFFVTNDPFRREGALAVNAFITGSLDALVNAGAQ